MPSYLRQWFVHQHGGGEPVKLNRCSPESDLLRMSTIRMPENILPPRQQDDEVAICIPYYKSHDPRTYNYLSKQGKEAHVYNTLSELLAYARTQEKNVVLRRAAQAEEVLPLHIRVAILWVLPLRASSMPRTWILFSFSGATKRNSSRRFTSTVRIWILTIINIQTA